MVYGGSAVRIAASPSGGGGGGAYPANESNTGYQNAGAVLGGGPYTYASLADGSGLTLQSNHTYDLYNFPSGLSIGGSLSGITFRGCRFARSGDNDNVDDSAGCTYLYCTFEPASISPGSEPAISNASYQPTHAQGYQYGIYGGGYTASHCRMWGGANNFGLWAGSTTVTWCLVQNPRQDGGVDHTDGIGDEPTNGAQNISALTIENNTVIGVGNTNALALQGNVYTNLSIRNNYWSGYGFMCFICSSSVPGQSLDTCVFSGNTWGSDLEPGAGPLYAGTHGSAPNFTTAGNTNTWANNKMRVVAGTSWLAAGNDGLYWWPNDINPSGPSQIIGHTSDFVHP